MPDRQLWIDYYSRIRARFAAANGWKVAKHSFDVDVLSKNKVHSYDYCGPAYRDTMDACDHPEFFRLDRRAAAIVAHNYAPSCHAETVGRVAERYGLRVHVPPDGKRASWYFPGGTHLIVLTRPDVIEIVWPTEDEMTEFARAAEQRDQWRKLVNGYWNLGAEERHERIKKIREIEAAAFTFARPRKELLSAE